MVYSGVKEIDKHDPLEPVENNLFRKKTMTVVGQNDRRFY